MVESGSSSSTARAVLGHGGRRTALAARVVARRIAVARGHPRRRRRRFPWPVARRRGRRSSRSIFAWARRLETDTPTSASAWIAAVSQALVVLVPVLVLVVGTLVADRRRASSRSSRSCCSSPTRTPQGRPCDRLTAPSLGGAWPSGKATGFGPVIPGSNPGAPAIVPHVSRRDLAAVVMAGGLGTRMRSATPKHLHPILGRRMVDWVLEAARRARRRSARRRRLARHRAMRSTASRSPSRQSRSGPATPSRSARDALDGCADDVLVLSGDTPLLTTELLESSLETHRARGAAATVLSFEPDDPRAYGRIVRDDGRRRRRDRRGRRRDRGAARDPRGRTPPSTSSTPIALWPALDRLDAGERAGRALPDRRRRAPRRRRRARRRARRRRPGRDRGREHARRARRRGRGAARPDQRGSTCSPA